MRLVKSHTAVAGVWIALMSVCAAPRGPICLLFGKLFTPVGVVVGEEGKEEHAAGGR